MTRLPQWLIVVLLPVVFLGSCTAAVRPVWACLERLWIRPVGDSDTGNFPVLVRNVDATYSTAPMGRIPPESSVVTREFDEDAINRDLNASVGDARNHRYFRVLERDADVVRVELEVPTRRDRKHQGWYAIRGEQVVPQRSLLYGPGFAFLVLPVALMIGFLAAWVFDTFMRRQNTL